MGRKGPENWLGPQCVGAEPQIHVQDSIFDLPGCAFWAPFLTEFSLGSVRQPSLCLFLQTQNILLSSFPASLEQWCPLLQPTSCSRQPRRKVEWLYSSWVPIVFTRFQVRNSLGAPPCLLQLLLVAGIPQCPQAYGNIYFHISSSLWCGATLIQRGFTVTQHRGLSGANLWLLPKKPGYKITAS